MNPQRPPRGEVWFLNPDPTRDREQAGSRPALIGSVDLFKDGPADLAVVLPITSKAKGIGFHVAIEPPEGGVRQTSFIKCEDVRSVSRRRITERWGAVTPVALAPAEDRLRIPMGL